MAILGIDAGNYETKVCVNDQVYSFPSDIGEYRELRIKEHFSKDDIVWEYKGEKGFAGTLAKYESEYGGTIKGITKAHPEAILRALIAIHKYGDNINQIIVGQPISTHVDKEKQKIKDALIGEHTLKINEVEKTFVVDRVEVSIEGTAAIISNPVKGLVRIIDIGSGTTNFATLNDMKKIDKGSFTKRIGTEIMINKDPKEMAKGIRKIISSHWKKDDAIFVTGGGAEKIYPHLNNFLYNCQILKPRIGNSLLNTKYANVVGFYKLAKGVFEVEEKHEDTSN